MLAARRKGKKTKMDGCEVGRVGRGHLDQRSGVTSLLGSRVATKSTLDSTDTFSVGIMVYSLQRGVPDLLLLSPWPILRRARTWRLGTQQRPQTASVPLLCILLLFSYRPLRSTS